MTSTAESTFPSEETDVFKQFLVDTVQEVATSLSFSTLSKIFMPLCGYPVSEFSNHMQDTIVQSMNPLIDHLSQEDIGNKMIKLKELINESPPEGQKAWRPKIRKPNKSGIEGHTLEERKAKLLEAIATVDEENEKLRQVIISKRKLLQDQKDKIDNLNVSAKLK